MCQVTVPPNEWIHSGVAAMLINTDSEISSIESTDSHRYLIQYCGTRSFDTYIAVQPTST